MYFSTADVPVFKNKGIERGLSLHHPPMQDMEIADEERGERRIAMTDEKGHSAESLAARWRRTVGLAPLREMDAKISSPPSPSYWPNDDSPKPKSMIQRSYESNDAYVKRLAQYLTLAPLCGEGTAAALCGYVEMKEKSLQFLP